MIIKFGDNAKMKPGKIGYISMPAHEKICGRNCYGCYAKRVYTHVAESRWRNYLEACNARSFKIKIKAELDMLIEKNKIKALRINDSGEFFSQKYIDSLTEVLKQYPKLKVFAFTKRLADFNFDKLRALKNVVIIDSLKYGIINYGSLDYLSNMIKAGAYLCKATKDHSVSCNNGCTYCLTKKAEKTGVVFVRH